MQEITTTDLSKFGYREKAMASDLLKAMVDHGLPNDFEDNEVTVMMNTNSGNVFLTNSEYQVAMLTYKGKLESFYSCPICGCEGFWDEVKNIKEHSGSDRKECKQWIKDIKANQ